MLQPKNELFNPAANKKDCLLKNFHILKKNLQNVRSQSENPAPHFLRASRIFFITKAKVHKQSGKVSNQASALHLASRLLIFFGKGFGF